jgi:hypothetical protein
MQEASKSDYAVKRRLLRAKYLQVKFSLASYLTFSYFSYIVIQMPVRKFEDPKIEQQILDLLQETAKPTTTDYVATNLKISWSTARMMLLSMALHGKIGILETTNSCVFLLKKTEAAQALNQPATSTEEASTLTESATSNE